MEQDQDNKNRARDELAERRGAKRREELLAFLPPPSEAAWIITASLEEEAHAELLRAIAGGRPIDEPTARLIAYSLVAHAPRDASTENLYRFFAYGEGTHAELVEEYLPLYRNAEMPAEGRLLLDALGTSVFQHEHPETLVARRHRQTLDSGLFYTEDGNGERVAVAFQFPMSYPREHAPSLAEYLTRRVRTEGDAFRAFLRLPGVDATSPGLLNYYRGVHLPSDAARRLAQERGAMRHTRGPVPDWEAVEIGGQLYDFSR